MLEPAAGRGDVGMPAFGHATARELDVALVERRLDLEQQCGLFDVEDLRHGEGQTVALARLPALRLRWKFRNLPAGGPSSVRTRRTSPPLEPYLRHNCRAYRHALGERLAIGLRKPGDWVQLAKFCAGGASGYVVNLLIFAIVVGPFDQHHLIAATAAFLVAVTNNFIWNHYWTFGSPEGRKRFQALRFFAVSVVAFLFGAAILELLVSLAGVRRASPRRRSQSCAPRR